MMLWSFEIETDSRDCDGSHHERREFLAVETPSEVVYDRANLFAMEGPSTVRLGEGASDDAGFAYVSEPNDEGGHRSYTISWKKVTDPEQRDAFLKKYEDEGPRVSIEHRYTDLYRERVRQAVRAAYPDASHLTLSAGAGDHTWEVTQVHGWQQGSRYSIWSETTGKPFTPGIYEGILHDLDELYGPGAAEPEGTLVRL